MPTLSAQTASSCPGVLTMLWETDMLLMKVGNTGCFKSPCCDIIAGKKVWKQLSSVLGCKMNGYSKCDGMIEAVSGIETIPTALLGPWHALVMRANVGPYSSPILRRLSYISFTSTALVQTASHCCL